MNYVHPCKRDFKSEKNDFKFSFLTLIRPRKKILLKYYRCLKLLISFNMCKIRRKILVLKNIQKLKKLCKISLKAIFSKYQFSIEVVFAWMRPAGINSNCANV